MNKYVFAGFAFLFSCAANAKDLSPLATSMLERGLTSINYVSENDTKTISVHPREGSFDLEFKTDRENYHLTYFDQDSNGPSIGDFTIMDYEYDDLTRVHLTLGQIEEGYSVTALVVSPSGVTNKLSKTSKTLPWFAREKKFNEKAEKAFAVVDHYYNELINAQFADYDLPSLDAIKMHKSIRDDDLESVLVEKKNRLDDFIEGKYIRSMLSFRSVVIHYDKRITLN